MTPLTRYLNRMSEINRSGAGVKETSYYGTLEFLFNEIGKELKPKVTCILTLKDQGAGLPDGGLFTPSQFQAKSHDLIPGQPPERGCVEVKGAGDDIDKVAETEQVKGYLRQYGQVLVTNYHDFLLLIRDENGETQKLERYGLAPTKGNSGQSRTRLKKPSNFMKPDLPNF